MHLVHQIPPGAGWCTMHQRHCYWPLRLHHVRRSPGRRSPAPEVAPGRLTRGSVTSTDVALHCSGFCALCSSRKLCAFFCALFEVAAGRLRGFFFLSQKYAIFWFNVNKLLYLKPVVHMQYGQFNLLKHIEAWSLCSN